MKIISESRLLQAAALLVIAVVCGLYVHPLLALVLTLPVFGMAYEDNSDVARILRQWGFFDAVRSVKSFMGTSGMSGCAVIVVDAQSSLLGVGNAADTTDDLLFSKVCLGNMLTKNGSAIRISATGVTAANANNKTVKIIFGATTVLTSGVIVSNAKPWEAEVIITRISAATQKAVGMFWVDGSNPIGTVSAPTEDLTANSTAKLTGASPTTGAASDILAHTWAIEGMPLAA
jgi:hypothetical protein